VAGASRPVIYVVAEHFSLNQLHKIKTQSGVTDFDLSS
jgi:hypothetical protein